MLTVNVLIYCRFHYEYFKKKFPQAKLLFTDTDSLMYHVETNDIYAEMNEDKWRFDFASYDRLSPFYDNSNNKVIGKFKDETNGKPIKEFVGNKAKMYSFIVESEGQEIEKHRAKGIQRAVSKNLRHQQYKDQLHHPVENYHPNQRIGSKLHQLYSIEVHIILCSIKFLIHCFCSQFLI